MRNIGLVDTLRVDICYRPLRIVYAIHSDDIDAFRQAVRLSHTLWGGRFNPVVVVDREDEARRLIDLFRVDFIWPIGDSAEVKAFPKKFPYLIKPFFHDTLFVGGEKERKHAQLLDVQNALVYLRDRPEWKAIKDAGVRAYTWQVDDPLSNIFLIQFGDYPCIEATGINYRAAFIQAADATENPIDPAAPVPADVIEYPSIAYLSRYGLERHYSVQSGWNSPGFFVGDASNLDDLICYWNLRAADVALWFIDPQQIERFRELIPAWDKAMRQLVAHRHEWDRNVAVWSRRENIEEARGLFPEIQLMACHISEHLWNGRNLLPPMMHFDQISVLGVLGKEQDRPKVSFSLNEKPFCGDIWFHSQHLVASLSFLGGLYNDHQHTLHPPYIPELNEFYSRTMHFEDDKLRVEAERIGLVIDAADTDAWLYALSVSELVERIFSMAGYSAKLSNGGLIARQLISRLGGLQGARVFKIPGVRRLLKAHGPAAVFTKKSAIQLIAEKDPNNQEANFRDHQDLYIEPRPRGTKLKPAAVFAHLVEKGLFRIGAELTCPTCNMASWTALDNLKQSVVCELCGNEHDVTRQLVNGLWHYRRSGILGVERNAQGAVPVVLTLQQLASNLSGALHEGMYSLSLDLTKAGQTVNECEVDFVWIIPRSYPRKTVVILGGCKDQGPIKLDEFEKDINNLGRVADALPRKRFNTFVLLSKLSAFTPDEIDRSKALNTKYALRTILLTARELEPYHIYERTKAEFDIRGYGGTPEELAQTTAKLYFASEKGSAGTQQPGNAENGVAPSS